MKTVKIFLPSAFLAFLMITPVIAQNRFNPQDMAKRQSQYIFDNMKDLNATQKDSIQAIYLDFGKKFQEAFQKNSGDRQAMRSQMMTLRTERDNRIKGILTADQFKQYQELMQKMRNSRRRYGS